MKLNLEQLFDDPKSSNDILKVPSQSRRQLLLMLLAAPLATQILEGCGGNGSNNGNGSGGGSSSGITLSPQNPQVMAGLTVTFTVTAPTGVSGTVEYDWTQTSAYATLSAAGTTANKLTTSSLTVDLITTPSDSAPITVTVIAYQVTTSGRVQVGSATTTVTVLTTLAANTMSIISTDPNNSANNYTQTYPISLTIGDGALAGTWVWIIGDFGDSGDYPYQVRITTPVFNQLAPPAGQSLSVAYQAANTSPTWLFFSSNSNGGFMSGSGLVITRTLNGDGSYTYNLTFTATNHTQVVSGRASFSVKTFPPS